MNGKENNMNREYMMIYSDVMKALRVSRSEAYKIMKDLNVMLEQDGYKAIKGKIPRPYFETKFYGYSQMAM